MPRLSLSILALAVLPALLGACGGSSTEQAKKPVEEAAPPCDITLDTLAGKKFVLQKKGADGKTWEEDVLARASFYQEGDKLKVKYNTRALTDMYTYTCTKPADGSEQTCWEDNPRAADFCRALIANKGDGGCTVDEIIKITGLAKDKAEAGYNEVMAELKKLPPKEVEDMKKVFNNPNNQLRGIVHIKVPKNECRITLTDNYMTYSFGEIREMGNVVGSARFVQTDKDLVFEHCKESENLVALSSADGWAKPGETVHEHKAGQPVTFRYVGAEDLKPQAGCTYTMDTWSQYSPIAKNVPVETDSRGLKWTFSETYPKAGRFVAHIYRYKACNGGQPELLPVSCQGIIVK